MLYLGLGVFALIIIALDQFTKYLTVANIPLGDEIAAIPGLFHFTYIRNTGASFSMLEGNGWLFIGVLILFTVILAVILKKKIIKKTFEIWCLAAVWGGGVGNAIDRIRLGYVVDMIEVEFMNFAVFNVADIFICCGCFALVVYVLFFDRDAAKSKKGEAE